jgi:hypothetical protein
MEGEFWTKIIELGGTVAVVGMFIWYLTYRNGKGERAMNSLAQTQDKVNESLNKLHDSQERHTRVLINVARSHNLEGDANNLMEK